MLPSPCACGCNRLADLPGALIDAGFGVWRMECVGRVLVDLRTVQNMPPEPLTDIVTELEARGARYLAAACVGALPFTPRGR